MSANATAASFVGLELSDLGSISALAWGSPWQGWRSSVTGEKKKAQSLSLSAVNSYRAP